MRIYTKLTQLRSVTTAGITRDFKDISHHATFKLVTIDEEPVERGLGLLALYAVSDDQDHFYFTRKYKRAIIEPFIKLFSKLAVVDSYRSQRTIF